MLLRPQKSPILLVENTHIFPLLCVCGAAASKLLARDPKADAHALLEVHEGIVPGLDFCNHHVTAPKCWWEVVAPEMEPLPPAAKEQQGDDKKASQSAAVVTAVVADSPSGEVMVQLRAHRGAPLKQGEELMISYGDKSNEELLMLYGFAVPGNPNDMVMLHCPLPPASAWDQVMHARVEVVKVSSLRWGRHSCVGKDSRSGGGGPL